jgi:uncharacterized membrane protein
MFIHALEIITIGLPFCAFKCLTGLYYGQHWLVGLGIVDLVINFINLLSVIYRKKRVLDACFISFLVRLIKKPNTEVKSLWQDLGNSTDVLLSFILVAMVLATGAINKLPAEHLQLWNIAVILNVLGAGSGRLTTSLKNLRP